MIKREREQREGGKKELMMKNVTLRVI